MLLHCDTTSEFHPSRLSRMPACPHCGETLLASSAAEFLGQGRIRHTWSCDECGHEFRTLAAALRPRAA